MLGALGLCKRGESDLLIKGVDAGEMALHFSIDTIAVFALDANSQITGVQLGRFSRSRNKEE